MGVLEEKIKNTIKKFNLIEPEDKLVVGVSGGPDSIAMLNALYDLFHENKTQSHSKAEENSLSRGCQKGPSLVATHINHMIREEANDDEEFVRKFCEEKNIEEIADFCSQNLSV